MKKVLSLLVAYVFLQTQTWALSGGPVYNTSDTPVIGTYSGVLIPTTGSGVNVNASLNSIGVFSVAVPDTGAATGTFGFFGNAEAFNGSITAIADPDRGTLKGIMDGNTTLRAPGTTTTTFIGQAFGPIDTKIKGPQSSSFSNRSRLTGRAHLDVFAGQFNADGSVNVASTYDFNVDGFKQSNVVAASTVTVGTP